MNSLFPEETLSIDFFTEIAHSIGGNKKSYFIGKEEGFLRKYEGDKFSSYEFVTVSTKLPLETKSGRSYGAHDT